MPKEPGKITDNLLHIYDYCFTETVPYEFFKPKENRDIAVHLVGKNYHCSHCGKVTHIDYRPRPLTYYSKGKLAEERAVYEELGLPFPARGEIDGGMPFQNEAVGLCADCAAKLFADPEEPAQRAVMLAERLHGEDELVTAQARKAMEDAFEKWLDGLGSVQELLRCDLSNFNAVRDLICAVMLEDTAAEQETLDCYLEKSGAIAAELRGLLDALPDTFQAYTARSVLVYESMNDKIYHEYTVAFPADGTEPATYYLKRSVEKERVTMFLEQPRVETLEDLLMEVGFHGEWIDALTDRVKELEAQEEK